MNITYFANDGSYGDATGIVTVNTSRWSADDWDEIDAAADHLRISVALDIQRRLEGGGEQMLLDLSL